MEDNKNTVVNIDTYIANFPEEVQEILEKIRALIKAAVPEAEEAIKYGIPTFTLKGNLVHFAAYKHHIGFYIPRPAALRNSKMSCLLMREQKVR